MDIVRDTLLKEEQDYRMSRNGNDMIEGVLEELEDLCSKDPSLGLYIKARTLAFHNILYGSPSRRGVELVFVDVLLGFTRMFKKELELRDLERTYGR